MEMSRLTRDGTTGTVAPHQFFRRERGHGNIHFPCSAEHKQDWQPYPVDPYSCHMCDHIYSLLVQTISLSEAVAKQFRTSYDDYREKIVVQTAQDIIPRRVARVDEVMALSDRRTIAMTFYRNARELSKLQLWEGLGRIAKVHRDTDVDADQLQHDFQQLFFAVECLSFSFR